MIISLDAKKIKHLIKCLSLHVKKKKKKPTKQAKNEIDKKLSLTWLSLPKAYILYYSE